MSLSLKYRRQLYQSLQRGQKNLANDVSFGYDSLESKKLIHWGRVMQICAGKLSIISSDKGWWPGRRQAIFWTNAGILLIGTLGTNFSEILSKIETFSFNKMHLKMLSVK